MTGKDRETKERRFRKVESEVGSKEGGGGSQHPVGNMTEKEREMKETI